MKTLVIAAAAIALAAPASALARPHPDYHGDRYERDHRGDHHRGKHADKRHPHGMPPGQAKKRWSRGEHVPRAYVTERTYYITEPARYRLRQPPPGYQWVRVDNDVYLAQTQTGLIADVVLSLFN
ncbi:RcnB family protein [Phenylobacterium sp.]|uniref:RcnB family protein n=1 Tax=Phenylobacterium sp. TaxID=1871053 RepID=UPI00272F07AD|nr:RcnB family protein [Phenylobacterium sp.]MDP1616482.1 RcnB family protein [Phenylobacterium sp.]MDP1988029.1 RcnB family protein [Phenylobacterium sp.]